jgi:uncharacterized membrane protein YphA (DoxX/SURF4 family)
MKYLYLRLKRFCGFVAGIVFFIAGIFKLLDPVGAGLVMKGYMDFFHLGFMFALAKPFAVALAYLETVIGAALVTGVFRRLSAIAAIAFQVFFTLITLILVIFNPEINCGCFGEVIHLSHLQTFLKNIILLSLLLFYAFPLRHLGFPKKIKYVSFGIVTISVAVFSVYSWIRVPMIDYTDFRPAAALKAGNAFSVAAEDMFEAVFVYEKDGDSQEFTLENLPDSTWSFVETRTVVKGGQTGNSADLSFYDAYGEYQDTLAVKGKVMVISVYNPKMKTKWRTTASFISRVEDAGFRPLLLVSASAQQMESVFQKYPEQAEVLKRVLYYSDYKTLMAMNRSNGGVTYFSDGYLVRKWASGNCPDTSELNEIYIGDDTEVIIESDSRGRLAFQGFLLYVFAIMLLL